MKTKRTNSLLFKNLSFLKLCSFTLSIFFLFSGSFSYANTSSSKRLGFWEGASLVKWELGLVGGGATYLGLKNWNWGSSNEFKMNDEGWFGMDTGSGGIDKLGHMYTSYLMDEFFTNRLYEKTGNWNESARLSAYYAGSIMLLVEVFDGYSDDHGFSYEDMVMNLSGIGLSYLRNTVPGLRDKFDFRMSYNPTQNGSDRPITDYSGMTYIAAIKPSGFTATKNTPLKYLEFQLGYKANGFKKSDIGVLDHKTTDLSVGIAVDLQKLLFEPARRHSDTPLIDYTDTFTRYYQLPEFAIRTSVNERKEKR